MPEQPTKPGPARRTKLLVPRAEAAQKIQSRIEKGEAIRNLPINSRDGLDATRAERSKWSRYNTELLDRLFDDDSISKEYNHFSGAVIPYNAGLGWWIKVFREDMDESITRLESIIERLELIPESTTQGPSIAHSEHTPLGKDVFVVHGHDESAKQSVARFLEKLKLRAIILHEMPNGGRTVIEKFEDFSNVGFAVILLTPDDLCSAGSAPKTKKARARQNVVFELGYFVGKLGRNRVCALYKEGVEIPSDYVGILFIEMDAHNGWQSQLAREIKTAGVEIDLNGIL